MNDVAKIKEWLEKKISLHEKHVGGSYHSGYVHGLKDVLDQLRHMFRSK